MTLAVVLIILIPFVFTFRLRAQDLPASLADSPQQPFDNRKNRIYEGLRDLQFEYRLGKLSEQDYQQSERGLQQELAKILPDSSVDSSPIHDPDQRRLPSEPPRFVLCPHCQKPWPPAMKFCGDCGRHLP